MRLRLGAVSRTGLVRPDNEDCMLVEGWVSACDAEWSADRGVADGERVLVGVFDGMGGHQGGAVASRLAATLVGHARIESVDALRRGLIVAHRAVQAAGQGVPGLAQMGTTAVVVLLDSATLAIAHAGDSRAYRHVNGALGLLTEPHRADDPFRAGATVLTQCLGAGREPEPSLEIFRVLRPQQILLCSDGLSDLVPETEIKELLTGHDPLDVARGLADAAYAKGADDNVSVIVLDLDPGDTDA